MASHPEKKNIVIVGGGIIGCSTAYFLTRHPSYDPSRHKITLLEATKIAGGSSGKAGGLLALWAFPDCIVPLSYRLHAELAAEHGGKDRWGYRKVHSGQLSAKARYQPHEKDIAKVKGDSISLQKQGPEALRRLRAAGVPADLDWFTPESVLAYEEMGDPSTTAQVHPYLFTTSMAALAEEKGVDIRIGTAVTSINSDPHSANSVGSVTYKDKTTSEEHTVLASTVILSAGPWTRSVHPPTPISGLRAHSVTIRPSRPVSAYSIFSQITLPSSSRTRKAKPEIYARPNNEVYVCGEGDTLVPLPASSDFVEVDESRCDDIVSEVCSISDELRDGEVLVRQACYLPVVDSGAGPLVGKTGLEGLLMAAGHTCWGIQNGPGTGKLVSELVFDGKTTSANISSLDPRKVL
ncbi:MAG: hypothetical protein M1832_003054 [Thelocarpon impressellum]|nr:MAG: hypothetical protein M1832_003054 [Thelocarpon impressellum]